MKQNARAIRTYAPKAIVSLALAGCLAATPSTALAEYRGYQDIPEDHWAALGGVVDWSLEHGAVLGYDDGRWDPDGSCDRAMAVTIVWRLAGSPEASEPCPFPDVAESDWFAQAVAWAAEEGIVSGIGETGLFDPYGNVTREQVAKILGLWSGFDPESASDEADLSAFADPETVSDWAAPHVSWAVEAGVISGRDADGVKYVAGQDGCTRAEFAAMAARTVDGWQAGEDVSGDSYVVDAVWVPEYGQVEVPVFEERWVDDVESVECYRYYCVHCGYDAVIPKWIVLDDMYVNHLDYAAKYEDLLKHISRNDCGADFNGIPYVDWGQEGEIIWQDMPTGTGHWETVQVGTRTETVETGGHWEFSNGRWE